MTHQVQGMVFRDGDWVSQPADVYRIMARAQQRADTEMREPVSKPQNIIPKLGILSRTVFSSPSIKSVLSANIRHKTLNDVVFVGEDAVHLKEIQAYGHLRHAATKSDFTGRILAAKVFSEPRKVEVYTDWGKRWNKVAVHAERKSFTADEADPIPPEVIVLTLSSRTLMFLWARQTQTGSVAFHQKTFRLPAGTSRHDRLGAFLAVDPNCRAIAVAAPEGRFMLYKTKNLDSWREAVRNGGDIMPIEDERLISLQGRVMHMEFLSRAKSSDESHVVLLFVLVHNGKTKITCYDWDCKRNLSTASVRAERVAIDIEDRNPSLLIPLNQSSDFLLVCNEHISLYRNILSGAPTRKVNEIPEFILQPRRPGESTGTALWVQWDRVLRNPEYTQEAFYIAREDGVVAYSEINDGVTTTEAGTWPYPMDKAFTTLPMDTSPRALSYPDVLMAAGVGSDGLLCKVGEFPTHYENNKPWPAHNTFTSIESIPNWAPISDLSVTRLHSHGRERDAIFTANGRAPHGSISELRKGLNAIIPRVDENVTGMRGCTDLWIIDHESRASQSDGRSTKQHHAVLLINLPPESIIIRITRTQQESDPSKDRPGSSGEKVNWNYDQIASGGEHEEDDILRDHTISACMLDDEFALQVTHKEARLLRRSNMSKAHSISFPNSLLAAATASNAPCLAVVLRENGSRVMLHVTSIQNGAFGKSISHEIGADPTCLELIDIDGIPHVFVGKSDLSFTLFRVQEHGELLPVYDDIMDRGPDTGLRMLCESAVLLGSGENPVIVCGMRNGFLMSLALRGAGERYDLLLMTFIRMGTTAAQVTRNATDSSAAFVACGPDLCRIRLSPHTPHTIDVDSIWFTADGDPAFKQCPVSAIDQLPFSKAMSDDKDLGGFIFTVSGDSLVFAQLDYDIRWSSYDIPSATLEHQKAIPRKMITHATPTKLMYLEKLNMMVVATVESREERAPPEGYRVVHSSIKLLKLEEKEADADTEMKLEDEVDSNESSLVAGEFTLKHYERVYSMMEWTFTDDKGKVFQFVVLGTGMMNERGETGRRLFLNVNESGIRLKKESTYQHPVRCIALYGENQIVSIIGNLLVFEQYKDAKWSRIRSKDLTSPGVHLSVCAPFVYISTAAHSHVCYQIISDVGSNTILFEEIFTDTRQRDSIQHLVLPVSLYDALPSSSPHNHHKEPAMTPGDINISEYERVYQGKDAVVLVTDKSCNVAGLYHPRYRTYKSATTTLFEACLPRSISRIQRGDVRPPWCRPCYDYTSDSSPAIQGVVADDIIGTATDGAVYAFSILSYEATRVLKFLQNLIERKKEQHPENKMQTTKLRSGDIFNVLMYGRDGEQDDHIVKLRGVDPSVGERGAGGPRKMHVDGDLLWRFFEENGDVNRLVNEGTEDEVKKLFGDLVVCLRETAARAEEMDLVGDGREGMVEWVERWARDVLMPVI